MTQEELMIGDWVQDKSDQTIFQIKTHWDIYNAKDFEPIPITQEILEKIGFTNEGDGYIAYFYNLPLDDKDIECAIKHYVVGGFELGITDNRGGGILRMCVDYVHELQHALKLCKIDKEIRI